MTAMMTREASVLLRPPMVPSAALELIDRAREGLIRAEQENERGERYVQSHLAALRTAAAVLAVRGRPRRVSGGSTLNVWVVLPRVAPELAEWSAYFAAGAARRQAVEAGRAGVVTAREADDLLRAATEFLEVVSVELGILAIG